MTAAKVTAHEVLQLVRDKHWSGQAYAWLFEVRNKTGASHASYRYADALVMSLYPSRGLWLAGVEVKVDRSDWLRELRDPKKSSEIQSYCDHWWIATPENVIKPEELPPTWGHLEVRGTKVTRAKAAPKNKKPARITPEFLASVLRNISDNQHGLLLGEYHRGYQNAEERCSADKVNALEEALRQSESEGRRAKQQLEWKEKELTTLRSHIAEFEKATGIEGLSYNRLQNVAKLYNVAQRLAHMAGFEQRLRAALEAYEPVAEVVREVADGHR